MRLLIVKDPQALGRRIQMRALVAEGSGASDREWVTEPMAEPPGEAVGFGLPRTAGRYWLLRFDEDELRFTHRADAERWASNLAERGTTWQLTWHDENTPLGAGAEAVRNVA
jgi:hypothetical protein